MITATDAYRDRDDNGPAPYRVRYLDSGAWTYMKTRGGKLRKFRNLTQACDAARSLEIHK